MIQHPVALVAVIAAITAAAFALERRFFWARQAGASLLVIALGAVLSNAGLVAATSPVYDAIGGPVTSLAIVWLLLSVRFDDLVAAGPRMLGGFALAVVGTVIGATVGTLLLAGALGDDAWKLAGVMTGTYSGGSLNFAAVGRAVGLSGSMFTAATAADNLMTSLWMGATLMLPVWLARWYPAAETTPAAVRTIGDEELEVQALDRAGQDKGLATTLTDLRMGPVDLLGLVALGAVLIVASEALAARVPWPIPSVLWLTTLALGAAQLPVVRRLKGSLPLGFLALNLFFAVIGIGSRVAEIFRVGPEVFVLTLIVVATHGVVLLAGAKLLRLDLPTAMVASQASIGGPSTAVALAAARGWHRLVLPGMAVGLLGYAVGNYAGLAVAGLMRGWLG